MSWFSRKPIPPRPQNTGDYRIAFWCPNSHVQNIQTMDTQASSVLGEYVICGQCGSEAKPAVCKIVREPRWDGKKWLLYDYKTEPLYYFVHYLDKEPDVELSERAVTKLKEFASRNPSPLVALENQTAYEAGLKDGVTELAKFVLEEMKETE